MTEHTFRRPIAWNSFAITDVGCVRQVNEDSIFEDADKALWAVADGMGGHEVGDVASRKIVEIMSSVQARESLSDYVDAVEDALMLANKELIEYAQIMFENETMGSTAVCLLIVNHVGVCLWVGDSRLYRYRNQQLQQLSRDHSQVAEMVQMGLITEEDAETHPHRNVITRAVGVERQLFVDVNVFSTQVGDTFLLCSDGLYNSVGKDVIERGMQLRDPEEGALTLLKQSIDNGAQDNVSIIMIKGLPSKIT
ncbi:Serine/threonine phosphatase stp [Thalassocella blandensis]|nr:Serine/threonine phosphatase stp [Thalassocella blandensis]